MIGAVFAGIFCYQQLQVQIDHCMNGPSSLCDDMVMHGTIMSTALLALAGFVLVHRVHKMVQTIFLFVHILFSCAIVLRSKPAGVLLTAHPPLLRAFARGRIHTKNP